MNNFRCPHCGYPYDPHDGNKLANSQAIEVVDNIVYITTYYQCSECRGVVRGTQRGEVVYWQDEEFEAV